ncbi:MAG TPA: FAD-dependent oxidoreductase, partial [Fluviicoccus sp.]|nr:FAD-dependent oxidoreductase [Fluviicoccus sp.]
MSAALETEIVIAGGGIAGITTALELLDQGRRVTLLERAPRERLGGLANEAFGGMLFGGTGLQRLNGIHDSPELFRDDWYRAAEFGPDDHWPKRWADTYVERCVPDVHDWVRGHGVHYFPIVHWVERGDHRALNSLPRYHVLWGTGLHLTQTLIRALDNHPHRDKLDLRCGHYVEDFLTDHGRISGVRGHAGDVPFTLKAGATVVASGGINGNLQRVREVWDRERYGPPPALLLNGAHPDGDGHLHDVVTRFDGRVVRLGQMWNYATGIRHPQPQFPDHGLSLIP